MKGLLLTDEVVLTGDIIQGFCQQYSLNISDVTVSSSSQVAAGKSWPQGSFELVLSLASSPQCHSVAFIGALAATLKPAGKLVLRQNGSEADLRRDLLLSGLVVVDGQLSGEYPSTGAAEVTATKPKWQAGASQPIKLRKVAAVSNGKASITSNGAVTHSAAVKLWGGALEDDDDELMDDDDLLTEEDRQRPSVPKADDCGASKKACKNCVCGRAELEAAGEAPPLQKLTVEMLENPGASGGCGSCALGDAFRCGTCPYRGLPVFEPGKKIELGSDFLAVDV